jgi:hypothetical protein
MDASRVLVLRELLASSGWIERTSSFARSLRTSTRTPGGLLLVGTPDSEPWHLAAHLDDEARYGDIPELSPTLVRYAPPPGAPAHLAVTFARLEAARRGETIFVVAEEDAPEQLLERAADARRAGATILSLDAGDAELHGIAHESLTVVEADLVVPEVSFDSVQHLVSMAAGSAAPERPLGARDRLARLLDKISGPAPTR